VAGSDDQRPGRIAHLRNAFNRGAVPSSEHPHVLLACMPKSGSSYLMAMIAALPGMSRAELIRGHSRREHELALEQAIQVHDRGYVAQAHVRYSPATRHFIDAFSMTVVFQTRNLYDVVVSFHDHLTDLSTLNPVTYVPGGFAGWTRQRRLLFVADTVVPWYLNLCRSWSEYTGPIVRVAYHDLVADPRRELERVARAAGIAATPDNLDAAVRAARERPARTLNVGGEGRGRALPVAVRGRIDRLVDYHPRAELAAIL
jgi:hypothetical protein